MPLATGASKRQRPQQPKSSVGSKTKYVKAYRVHGSWTADHALPHAAITRDIYPLRKLTAEIFLFCQLLSSFGALGHEPASGRHSHSCCWAGHERLPSQQTCGALENPRNPCSMHGLGQAGSMMHFSITSCSSCCQFAA